MPDEESLAEMTGRYQKLLESNGTIAFKKNDDFSANEDMSSALYLEEYQQDRLTSESGSYDRRVGFDKIGRKTYECVRTFAMIARFRKRLNERVEAWIEEIQDTPDGRKLARHLTLGAYARRNGSVQDFFFSIITDIFQSLENAKRLLDDNIFLYREVSSDIFLIRMLNLDAFGYFNFVTRHMPSDGQLGETYFLRICMALYATENGAERTEADSWEEIWKDIFSEVCRFIGKTAGNYADKPECDYGFVEVDSGESTLKEQAKEHLFRLAEAADAYSNKDLSLSETIDVAGDLVDYLRALRYAALEKTKKSGAAERRHQRILERYQSDLNHCCYLAMNYLQLVYEYKASMRTIQEAVFCGERVLAEDLARGSEKLRDLYEEFRETPLWKNYGAAIHRRYCGEPGEAGGAMMDFVLSMHYAGLIRGAKREAAVPGSPPEI